MPVSTVELIEIAQDFQQKLRHLSVPEQVIVAEVLVVLVLVDTSEEAQRLLLHDSERQILAACDLMTNDGTAG